MPMTYDQFKDELDKMTDRVKAIRTWISDVDKINDSTDKQLKALADQIERQSQQLEKIENTTKSLVENTTPQKVTIPLRLWITICVIIAAFIFCGGLPVVIASFSNTTNKIPLLVAGILILSIFATTIIVVVHQVISFINKGDL